MLAHLVSQLTDRECAALLRLLAKRLSELAIKAVKARLGLGLKEVKDVVDAWCDRHAWTSA